MPPPLLFRAFIFHVSHSMFDAAPLSEPSRVGDRLPVPARGPSVGGVPSRAIQLPGIMFATLGIRASGRWAQILTTRLLKLQT